VIGIAWHSDRVFTDRERLMADLVSPHISQAWQNARLLSRMQSQMQMLQAGIECLGAGIIVCGPLGRVQFINAQARRYLAEYFGTTRHTDRSLPEQLSIWLRRQDRQLYTGDDAPPARAPLICERESKRLVIRLLSQPDAHLILIEEERIFPETGAIEAFGLTARETEVLTWIARGKSNIDIASILQMHVGTVKKHVEHIFMELGVETRTAAALALASKPFEDTP
jgi:DNA-binding CsgD family transcriptional regulator